jgi:hypothetical protein
VRTVADVALAAGGEVTGVMPQALVDCEIAHSGLSRLHVVGSMYERKAMMVELSEGFVALSSGTGRLEEFSEFLTWAQLGERGKPCGLLNVAGHCDPLLGVFDHMVDRGFLAYGPPKIANWIDRSEP